MGFLDKIKDALRRRPMTQEELDARAEKKIWEEQERQRQVRRDLTSGPKGPF